MKLLLIVCLSMCAAHIMAASTTMPIGNLTNWRQIFTDDFIVNVPLGSFPGPYANKWMSYHGFGDTSNVGWYDQYKVLSVQNGNLDFYMHTDPQTGKPLGAAPIPFLNSDGYWGGMVYGRYSLRFRADSLQNYGTGWLLWPDTNNWNEGEIDFPEGSLDGNIFAYNHCVGNPQSNCFYADTGATFTDWHIATIEWTPTYVRFILDDVIVGTSTNAIPTTPLHWVLQAATTGALPSPQAAGHIQIDWVSIWAWDPSINACGASQGVVTDSFTSLNTARWTIANGNSWGQSYFKNSQSKASSSGLTLNMTKSGCPSGCGGLAQQSGKIESIASYATGTVQIIARTSAYATTWLGWEASSPRDGYEVQLFADALAVMYYKNSAYNYGGYFTLPFDASAAYHKYTFARTNTKFEVYADGAIVASLSGSNLPTSSGKISLTLQADDAITVQSTTARISSYTYLPAGCPYTK